MLAVLGLLWLLAGAVLVLGVSRIPWGKED